MFGTPKVLSRLQRKGCEQKFKFSTQNFSLSVAQLTLLSGKQKKKL